MFGLSFDTTSCVFNDRTISYRQCSHDNSKISITFMQDLSCIIAHKYFCNENICFDMVEYSENMTN